MASCSSGAGGGGDSSGGNSGSPPTVTIANVSGTYFDTATPSFTFTVSGAASVLCYVDDGATTSCSSPYVIAATADGTHTFSVTASSADQQTTTVTSGTFTIDTARPVVSNLAGPANCVSGACTNSVTFTVSDVTSGVASTVCSVNAGTATACSSPFTIPASYLTNTSATGAVVTVGVSTTDRAGNSSTTQTTSFTVSAASVSAPVVTIANVNGAYFATATPSFTFTATDSASTVTSVQCQVDQGATASCTSPYVIAATADGTHTISVTATNANQVATKAVSGTFTIDTVKPVVSNLKVPANCVSGACTSSVTFTTSDPTSGVASIACSINSGTATACSSPFTIPASYLTNTGASAATVTVGVASRDRAGNTSTTQTASFTVTPASPPVVTISNVSGSYFKTATPSFTFTVTDTNSTVSSVVCQVDAGASAACTSPYVIASSADGTHTISVTATNAASQSTKVTSGTFTIDTVKPVVSSLVGPANCVSGSCTNSVTFTVSDVTSGVASTVCSVNAGTAAACTSPFTIPASYLTNTGTAATTVTVSVSTTDKAGNVSTTQSTSFTVTPISPPVVTIGNVSGSYFKTATPSFTFTVTDSNSTVSSVVCQVDAGASAACTSPYVIASTADGTHTISVTATNAASQSTKATSGSFTIDTVKPVVSNLVGPANCVSGSCTSSVTFTATDATSGIASTTCSVNAGTAAACTSPFTIPSSYLSNTGSTVATVTVAVATTDKAGNVSTTQSTSFTVSPVASGTGPAILQAISKFYGIVGSTTQVLTLPSASTAGSTLVVFVREGNGGQIPQAGQVVVTDNMGNTYTLVETQNDTGTARWVTLMTFVAVNVKAGATNISAAFARYSGGYTQLEWHALAALEVSGVSTNPLVDHASNMQALSGTTADSITSTIMTAGSSQAIVIGLSNADYDPSASNGSGCGSTGCGAPSAGTGFTAILHTDDANNGPWNLNGMEGTSTMPSAILEYRAVAAGANVAATFTPKTADTYITMGVMLSGP